MDRVRVLLLITLVTAATVVLAGEHCSAQSAQPDSHGQLRKAVQPTPSSSEQPAVPPIPANAPRISKESRYQIIREFETQLVYARTSFPMGKKGLLLKDGVISPNGEQLRQDLALWGPAVKPGDPAHISYVQIKDDHIHFEINGGPTRRKKWYQRVEITGANGTPVGGGPDEAQANPHGTFLDLYFDKHVPEMTVEQARALLYPVLDFNAKNKEQAYLDSVPPKVKAAIQAHHVLVGMNQEMVLYAKGKPPKKDRERDGETEYEEWIYGEPPADVDFVRFVGEEVVRVETMKVDGEKIVRTEKEVILEPSDKERDKEAKKEPAEQPANAPTLRRPGEDSQDVPKPANGASPLPTMPPPDIPQPPGEPNGMLPAR
ncbi:MAG: hypothetical protein WBW31_06780 [Candidatus Sulfotelmatobacter sp.]